jgi:hypothetical protein
MLDTHKGKSLMLCPCLLQVVPSHSAPITSFQLRSGLPPSKDADVALVAGYCCLPVSAEKACLVPLSPHRSASSQLLHLVPIRGSRVLDHPSQTHSNESCTSSRSVAGLLLPRSAGLSAISLSPDKAAMTCSLAGLSGSKSTQPCSFSRTCAGVMATSCRGS